MGRTSCPAEGAQAAFEGRQGLGVAANLGRYEAESGALAGIQGTTGAETEDTAGTVSMAATGNRVESVRRDAAAAAAAAADDEAAAAAAADVGSADSVPKVWAVLLPAVLAVLAEVWAAEAGRWVWLGVTESESAVGSWSEAWSYQCQELSASDNSDIATPGPADKKQIFMLV